MACFCYQDSPRRAHSIAAQGGINAAKNYQNDGDSIYRLFYDTIKGGDFRAREANVYRLAQVSSNIIDQCVAQGVPFAREYGGLLANRSFGGAQVSRTFYARGQTGQQLLLGAYQALERQVGAGTVKMYTRHEMLELVVVDGVAKGIVTRDLVTGEFESHVADAVCLATGGYVNVFYLSTNAKGCNVTAIWRAYKKGAAFANPCYTQIHPTCIPVTGEHQSKLTLMSESLRNDGRIWVPKKKGDKRPAGQIPEEERDYYLERKYPSYGNLAPRDIASRAAKQVCDDGRGVGDTGLGVYLDFTEAIKRLGEHKIEEKYGNLFEMYDRITDEDPYKVPMRIYPASHYTMGGLWVDYNLMSTIPGLFVHGRGQLLRPRRQPPGRLARSCRAWPTAISSCPTPSAITWPASSPAPGSSPTTPNSRPPRRPARPATTSCSPSRASETPTEFHRELGKIMWEYCGMARNEAGLKEALKQIPALRERVLAERQRARQRRRSQPDPGKGRPRGRFPGVGRAHVPGCPGAARILRRPFPRGMADRGRRGQARRREFLPRRRLGVHGRRATAQAQRGSAHVRQRPSRDPQLQVRNGHVQDHRHHAPCLAPEECRGPGQIRDYQAKGVSTDMSFLEMLDVVNEDLIHKRRGARSSFDHDCREGICGACNLVINGRPHGPGSAPPPASCTCAASRTATASPSSRCGPRPSR